MLSFKIVIKLLVILIHEPLLNLGTVVFTFLAGECVASILMLLVMCITNRALMTW
jgi:hypothetical protein